MMKRHLLLTLAMVAAGLAAPAANAAAKEDPVRSRAQERKKPAAQQRSPKGAKKPPQAVKPKAAPKPSAKALPKAAPVTAGPRISTDTESAVTRPGDYAFSIQHGGMARLYRVHVPASYEPAVPAPLLVALHGTGRNMDLQANDGYFGLIGKSERERFVVVFPNAAGTPGETNAVWNAGSSATPPGVDDVGFIRQVVTNVFLQMSIDRSRIYATGISSGGAMVYRLACEMPGIFRAVAPVAAADNTADCIPAKPVSVLHIHARNDVNAPFGGGAGPAASAKTGSSDAASVPHTVAKWAKLNGCVATPRRILDKDGAWCEAYSYCRGQSEVQLCVTESGGHSWPGGKAPRGEAAPSVALSATDTMWDFFNRH